MPTERSLGVGSTATNDIPAKIASGGARIAVVMQLNAGDYWGQWFAGVQREAKRFGIKLNISDAGGDHPRQALHLQEAVASKPDAIIVGLGDGETLRPGLEASRSAGIPIVGYYLQAPPSKDVAVIVQDDRLMTTGVLQQFVTDLGGGKVSADVIYVYAPGYYSLDIRDTIWKTFVKDNPGVRTVATIGAVNPDTAAQVATQTKAALTANRDVKAIIAPWDGFAKGATLGVEELGLQKRIKVYGIDISNADIAVMCKPDSPWVVTATADAANVGSIVMRAAALKAAGQLDGEVLTVPAVLVTQGALRAAKIQNVDQLSQHFPGLRTPKMLAAPWMGKMS
jgi:simple sugar transport system substrate-binding protein